MPTTHLRHVLPHKLEQRRHKRPVRKVDTNVFNARVARQALQVQKVAVQTRLNHADQPRLGKVGRRTIGMNGRRNALYWYGPVVSGANQSRVGGGAAGAPLRTRDRSTDRVLQRQVHRSLVQRRDRELAAVKHLAGGAAEAQSLARLGHSKERRIVRHLKLCGRRSCQL